MVAVERELRPQVAPTKRPTRSDIAVFFRSTATLVEAGVPLVRALDLTAAQTENPALRLATFQLADRVEKGASLSNSLRLSDCFSVLHCRMISVGEESGTLDRILGHLADHEEKSQRVELRLRSSLTYPAVVLGALLLMGLFGPAFVFEGIYEFIQSSGAAQSGLVKLVIWGSALLRSPWFILSLLLLGGLSVKAWKMALRRPGARELLMRTVLGIPYLSGFVKEIAVLRFTYALSVQLQAGCKIDQAATLAAEVSGNPLLQQRVTGAVGRLRAGATLRQSLESTGFFAPMYLNLTEVGEQAGATAKMLVKLTEYYEENIDATLDSFLALVEPVAIALVGLVTGVVVMIPMMSIVSVLETL